MTNPLEDQMRKALLRSIVQRQIFCQLTGDLLDIRTCVVVLDSDGDPTAVFSPKGYQWIMDAAKGRDPQTILAPGNTFDPTTIPSQEA